MQQLAAALPGPRTRRDTSNSGKAGARLGQRTHASPAARAGPHTASSRGRAGALAALCVALGGSGEAQWGLGWVPE
jgi:hypothetical protein